MGRRPASRSSSARCAMSCRSLGCLDPIAAGLDEAGLLARAEAITAGSRAGGDRSLPQGAPGAGQGSSPPALWSAMMTDHDFFVPAMRFAELQSDQAPSYAYLFTWPSPVMGGVFGSIHGIDLPFMWGLHNDLGLVSLVGDLTAAEPLSTMIQDALLAFARTGDPVDECARLAGLRSPAASDHDLRSHEHDPGRTTGGRAPVLGSRTVRVGQCAGRRGGQGDGPVTDQRSSGPGARPVVAAALSCGRGRGRLRRRPVRRGPDPLRRHAHATTARLGWCGDA